MVDQSAPGPQIKVLRTAESAEEERVESVRVATVNLPMHMSPKGALISEFSGKSETRVDRGSPDATSQARRNNHECSRVISRSMADAPMHEQPTRAETFLTMRQITRTNHRWAWRSSLSRRAKNMQMGILRTCLQLESLHRCRALGNACTEMASINAPPRQQASAPVPYSVQQQQQHRCPPVSLHSLPVHFALHPLPAPS